MADELRPSQRVLMAPGPTDVDPAVLRVMAAPVLGHTDPEFHAILARLAARLRAAFQTRNELTLTLSATGTGAMEACLANVVSPGDRIVVAVAGYFAERLALIGERLGAEVVRVQAPWGTAVEYGAVRTALAAAPTKVLAMVHGETSTGVLQPLAGFGDLAREHDALLLVDTVPTLTGVPCDVDDLKIDMCYTGSQKCISAPPGLAPVTFNDRARAAVAARRTPCSFYFDLEMLARYWFGDHTYHHTPPVTLYYALAEALRLIEEETLPRRFERHARLHRLLLDGLDDLGLQTLVAPELRLATVTTVKIPDGIDDLTVRRALLQRYGVEITGGLGEFKGKIWRVGLMGYSCQERNVLLLLAGLRTILTELGYHPHRLYAGAVRGRAE
jgi:alanine-glyoxylate transaminase/serine-glyoxylate transaminase/serine-pyruvate transaminase